MRLSHELEYSRDLELQARQEADRLQEDLKLKDEEIRKQKADFTTDTRKLKAEIKAKELAALAVAKPETKEFSDQADDKKSEKAEIFSLKSKLKVVEMEKKAAENQKEELRKKYEDLESSLEDINHLKDQLQQKEDTIQSLKDDLLQKKKQMTTDRKNIKQLEKQLETGRVL